MIVDNKYIISSPDNSDTKDIINALCVIVPAAIQNFIDNNFIQQIQLTGNPIKDGTNICKFIQDNVKYKADGFNEQKIKLPGQLIKTKLGDCKSLSLFFLCAANVGGYDVGFKFASYSKNKKFTHVYNYIKHNNIIYTFDACVKDFKENKNYTNTKKMKVTYLAGVPTMVSDLNGAVKTSEKARIGKLFKSKKERQEKKQARQEKRQEKKQARQEKRKNIIKRTISKGKKVLLAGPRGAFILLTDINFRGLARKLKLAREKAPEKYKELWLKLGGDVSKLDKAVNTGITKKPFLGAKKGLKGIELNNDFIGDPATVITAITSAAAIIAAFGKLFKSLGIKSKKDEGTDEEIEELTKDENGNEYKIMEGEDFSTIDNDGEEAENYTNKGIFNPNLPKTLTGKGNKINPLLIGLGGLALIFLLKNNKK